MLEIVTVAYQSCLQVVSLSVWLVRSQTSYNTCGWIEKQRWRKTLERSHFSNEGLEMSHGTPHNFALNTCVYYQMNVWCDLEKNLMKSLPNMMQWTCDNKYCNIRSGGCRDPSMHAPSQWDRMLHCNVISHWLGAYTKWSLWLPS